MGDELLLLAIDPRNRRIRDVDRVRFALRVAELTELVLAGRIAVGARRIDVLDDERVEDPRLNNVMRRLRSAVPPPTLKDWLRRTPPSLTTEYLSRLEDQKLVRVRRRRRSGGYTQDILAVDLPRRQALVDRIDRVLRSTRTAESASDHDLHLAALVHAARLGPVVHPGLRGMAARRRLAAVARDARLAPVNADATLAADEALAAKVIVGADVLTRLLADELTDVYADFTTGGHSLGHDLNPGGWSGGDAGHHSGGHHGGGHDGGGHGGGGW